MGAAKAYKLSLVFPLLIPVLLSPCLFSFSLTSESFLSRLTVIIVYSGLYGGIPYLVLAGSLLWWMHGKNERQVKTALLISPPLMIVSFGIFLAIVSLALSSFKGEDNWLLGFYTGLIIFSGFIFIFGYAYVALIFLIVGALKQLNLISTFSEPRTFAD